MREVKNYEKLLQLWAVISTDSIKILFTWTDLELVWRKMRVSRSSVFVCEASYIVSCCFFQVWNLFCRESSTVRVTTPGEEHPLEISRQLPVLSFQDAFTVAPVRPPPDWTLSTIPDKFCLQNQNRWTWFCNIVCLKQISMSFAISFACYIVLPYS